MLWLRGWSVRSQTEGSGVRFTVKGMSLDCGFDSQSWSRHMQEAINRRFSHHLLTSPPVSPEAEDSTEETGGALAVRMLPLHSKPGALTQREEEPVSKSHTSKDAPLPWAGFSVQAA